MWIFLVTENLGLYIWMKVWCPANVYSCWWKFWAVLNVSFVICYNFWRWRRAVWCVILLPVNCCMGVNYLVQWERNYNQIRVSTKIDILVRLILAHAVSFPYISQNPCFFLEILHKELEVCYFTQLQQNPI